MKATILYDNVVHDVAAGCSHPGVGKTIAAATRFGEEKIVIGKSVLHRPI
jgi:hypothetical protein